MEKQTCINTDIRFLHAYIRSFVLGRFVRFQGSTVRYVFACVGITRVIAIDRRHPQVRPTRLQGYRKGLVASNGNLGRVQE